ncbi:unnamed protein product [Paramecium primaurelia]|uniref:Protein kinase domain-containing protein n=1 Tax=Paramecium primaurelia TaxID=5886 RepID=A0A8S1PYW8_PARPR|nr:unnamed protein product [Paramecium primaurelia]
MNQILNIQLDNKFQIGRGRLGGTYKVLNEQKNGLVQDKVVKVILKNPQVPKQLLTRKEELRFAFNFQNLKNINHNNCVKILDYQEVNGYAIILMKKYDYNLKTFSEYRDYDFEIYEYLLLLNQVTSAYLKLIELGIKYGRFKSQNILVSQKQQGKELFYLADYGFEMIDKDKSVTNLNFQVPSVDANEAQNDMYQFGICIAQMGINYTMKYKNQLEYFHNLLNYKTEYYQVLFEDLVNQSLQLQLLSQKNYKLPPLIAFILNSMIVHNPSSRITWIELMQLLQFIRSANPQYLNSKFYQIPNFQRWEIINGIKNLNQIARPFEKQYEQIKFLQVQQQKGQQQIFQSLQKPNLNINQKN